MPKLIDIAPDPQLESNDEESERLEQVFEEENFSEQDAIDTAENINSNLGYEDEDYLESKVSNDEYLDDDREEKDSDNQDQREEKHKKEEDDGGEDHQEKKEGRQQDNRKSQDNKPQKSPKETPSQQMPKNMAKNPIGKAPMGAPGVGAVGGAGGGAAAGGAAATGTSVAVGGTAAAGGATATAPIWGPVAAAVGVILLVILIVIFSAVIMVKVLGIGSGEAAEEEGTEGGNGGGGGDILIPGAPRGCPMIGYITTPYGFNIPGYTYFPTHYAIDIGDGNGTNTTLYATISGTVTHPPGNHPADQILEITSPDGEWVVRYHHMQVGSRVPAGSTVQVGDPIGNENETGNVDGEHVHYVVRRNGILVNPAEFFPPGTTNYSQPPGDDFSAFWVPPPEGWGYCGVLPQDASPVGGLSYYIKYGDTSILPSDPNQIKDIANAAFPDNNINKPCPRGLTCWDYVIQVSIENGISPAFAITIWWEEGAFGGLLRRTDGTLYRANSEFGCFPGGNTSLQVDFQDAFDCFVDFTKSPDGQHPYDPADPYGSFEEWVSYFCGPNQPVICGNNPNFINNLRTVYEDVAPGQLVPLAPGTSSFRKSAPLTNK